MRAEPLPETERLLKLASVEASAKLLVTVAMALLATIGDVRRFSRPRASSRPPSGSFPG